MRTFDDGFIDWNDGFDVMLQELGCHFGSNRGSFAEIDHQVLDRIIDLPDYQRKLTKGFPVFESV